MITYSKAKASDINGLVDLAVKFEQEHIETSTKDNPRIKPFLQRKDNWPEMTKSFFLKTIRSRKGIIYIAKDNDKMIGYTLLEIKNSIPIFRLQKNGYISDLFVLREYRGQGISSKFFQMAIDYFKKKKCEFVSIGVHFGNKDAREIYKKWGFIERHVEMYHTIN